jgi:hypothetical protein
MGRLVAPALHYFKLIAGDRFALSGAKGTDDPAALESRAVCGIRHKKDSPTLGFLLSQNQKGPESWVPAPKLL